MGTHPKYAVQNHLCLFQMMARYCCSKLVAVSKTKTHSRVLDTERNRQVKRVSAPAAGQFGGKAIFTVSALHRSSQFGVHSIALGDFFPLPQIQSLYPQYMGGQFKRDKQDLLERGRVQGFVRVTAACVPFFIRSLFSLFVLGGTRSSLSEV